MLPPGFMLATGIGVTIFNLFWISLTMCMCGHTNAMTAISTVPAFLGLAALVYFGRNNRVWERIMNGLFLGIQTIALAKNLLDVLWLGHSPLLG